MKTFSAVTLLLAIATLCNGSEPSKEYSCMNKLNNSTVYNDSCVLKVSGNSTKHVVKIRLYKHLNASNESFSEQFDYQINEYSANNQTKPAFTIKLNVTQFNFTGEPRVTVKSNNTTQNSTKIRICFRRPRTDSNPDTCVGCNWYKYSFIIFIVVILGSLLIKLISMKKQSIMNLFKCLTRKDEVEIDNNSIHLPAYQKLEHLEESH